MRIRIIPTHSDCFQYTYALISPSLYFISYSFPPPPYIEAYIFFFALYIFCMHVQLDPFILDLIIEIARLKINV